MSFTWKRNRDGLSGEHEAMISAATTWPVDLERGSASRHSLREAFGDGLCVRRRQAPAFNLAQAPLRIIATCGEATPNAVPERGWGRVAHMPWGHMPFRHALTRQLLEGHEAERSLAWLEAIQRWRTTEKGFYDADETSLSDLAPPRDLAHLFEHAGLTALEDAMTRLFEVNLRLHGPMAAHRLRAGQGVGVHADTPLAGEESHRLLLMLSRAAAPENGGHFLMLDGPDAVRTHRILPLEQNSAVAFELTARSYHAVTNVRAGLRYSIVFSFRAT